MGLSSLAGNLTGGLIGTSDAERAAGVAAGISKEAKEESLAELDTVWSDIESWLTPYLDEGATALTEFRNQLGLEPDAPVFDNFKFDFTDYQNSDAYKFMYDQGMQAVNRSAAAGRGLGSGNRMAALAEFGTGLASREYGNEFSRQLQTYGTNVDTGMKNYSTATDKYDRNMRNLSQLTTTGVNTANNLSSLRTNLGNMRTGVITGNAAAQTAAQLIPAQETMSFVNNLVSAGGTAAGAAMGRPPIPAIPAT